MSWKLEGVHMGLLRQMTGHKEKRQRDGIWRSEATSKVIKEAGNQILVEYIEKRQATVSEWVELRLILDI